MGVTEETKPRSLPQLRSLSLSKESQGNARGPVIREEGIADLAFPKIVVAGDVSPFEDSIGKRTR